VDGKEHKIFEEGFTMFNDDAQIRLGVNPIDFSIKEKEIQVENRPVNAK